MNRQQVFIGVDAGTSGVRCLCVAEDGTVVAQSAADLRDDPGNRRDDVVHEQSPGAWWASAIEVLQDVIANLAASGISTDSIGAVAVDGTSGTLVCLDESGSPLRPAMMYNDGRSSSQAEELNLVGRETCETLGYRFAASFALSKALWILKEEPQVYERTRFFVHQADYLAGCMTGRFDVTDYNNALKTGYDVQVDQWPGWIEDWDGLRTRLPEVLSPGEQIGVVSRMASRSTGLPAGVKVVAGTTDGMAGFLASGASHSGDCNTTLGTTLVFKAVSDSPAKDEDGAVYSHRLPGNTWLPGAASNTGAAWISAWYPKMDPGELDRAAKSLLPSKSIAYPLVGRGERFPFLNSNATGFPLPHVTGPDAYASCLQGTAFVERLAYRELSRCTGRAIENVFCTGGGCRSSVWNQLRSDVCGMPFLIPAMPEAAFGAAVLAASSYFGNLDSATVKMVKMQEKFNPAPGLFEQYSELFAVFLKEIHKLGYT